MAEQGAEVADDRDNRKGVEGGDIHLLDHMRQESRLRQDFQLDEAGRRLQDDRFQGSAPMYLTRGEDVADRDGEQEAPGERGPPPPDSTGEGEGSATDNVVAVIDRLKERVKVLNGPAGLGRGDEDDRVRAIGHPLLDRLRPAD